MNSTLVILNPSGTLIRKHTLSANCTRKFLLMNEDSITLRFSEREAMRFPVGSSVGDFFITQEQVGKWNPATGVWDYELKFDAYYWTWKNKILRYVINGVDYAHETSFTLTATIDVHANVIKNCLDLLCIKYANSPFRIETDNTVSGEAKLVRYDNLSILGGIQAIAEAYECEWWISGNAIYFGRCENNASQHVFEAGINTSSISYNQAKSEAPNRLYVYGSDRNLPPNYRKTDGNDTIGGVVQRRLMLPEGTPYLQTRPDIPETEIVEKVIELDSVYPRTELTISEDSETYLSQGEDEEGNSTVETFYRLKYGDEFRFSESYVLPNKELHIVFQSGLLNGMDFGAKFNPKGLNEKNTDGSWNPYAQMIEIVANEDYGRKLPDDVLKPQMGDKFILYGWDTTKMVDLGLIAKAEQELLEEGKKALEEYAKDLSSCTCPMAWDYMKPLFESSSQPKPGDAVTIIDTAHFGENGRKSRIIGFEYKLDKPYAECTYVCGENISVSRLKSLEQKIDGLAKSGTKVQMQNSLDFLSKRYDDRTAYGLEVGGLLSAAGGVQFGSDFVPGLNGNGGLIDEHANGELESLILRKWLEVPEIRFNKTEVVSGTSWRAPGGGIIEEVIPDVRPDGSPALSGLCRLKLEDGEVGEIKPDDLCMGIWHFEGGENFSGAEDGFSEDDSRGNFRMAGFMTVYFRITDVLDSNNRTFLYVLRSEANEGAADVPWIHRAHPAVGMHFVAYTNLTDVTRQTSCYHTRSYTRYLKGVRSWNFAASHIMMQFGDLSNLSVFGLDMSGYSAFLNNIYMRGTIQKVDAPIFELVVDNDVPIIQKGEKANVRFRVLVNDIPLSPHGSLSGWVVTRQSSDPQSDADWNALARVPADGVLEISFDDLGGLAAPMFNVSVTATEVIHTLSEDRTYTETLSAAFVIRGLETVPTDRGPWEPAQDYYAGDSLRHATGRYEISDVWHLGRRWRAQVSHQSSLPNAPCHGSGIWLPIEGDDSFSLRFLESYGLIDPAKMDITLTVIAKKANEIVTHSPLVSYEWSRYTENYDGSPRTVSDAAWAARSLDGVPRKWSGPQIRLTRADCDWDSLGPGKVIFTCLATLSSGQSATALFGMD